MGKIIEVDEKGGLYLPPEVLGDAQPHTRYILHGQNGTLTLVQLSPDQEPPFWATATPEERVKRFQEWAASHPIGRTLPDEAFSRDSMYD
jgi:hypothetical protein